MDARYITEEQINTFTAYLRNEEHAPATIENTAGMSGVLPAG